MKRTTLKTKIEAKIGWSPRVVFVRTDFEKLVDCDHVSYALVNHDNA